MATIPGTNISAYIVPFDTADTYATHVDTYGQGGYRVVTNLTERNEIPQDRQKLGMLVYVYDDDKTFRLISLGTPPLTNANFQEVVSENISGDVSYFTGNVPCVTGQNVYTVSYPSVLSTLSYPIATLSIPSETSAIFAVSVTNVNVSGFKIVLSGTPDTSGYSLNWTTNFA